MSAWSEEVNACPDGCRIVCDRHRREADSPPWNRMALAQMYAKQEAQMRLMDAEREIERLREQNRDLQASVAGWTDTSDYLAEDLGKVER